MHQAWPSIPTNDAFCNRQFYKLSKTHHPDRNPDDAEAAQRFVKISEAYAVVGRPDKRARYDRDVMRVQPASSGDGAGRGSYSSSSSGPFGSRPAAGLSKRRGTFRGPPPSFYRSGSYGGNTAKRAANAEAAAGNVRRAPRAESGAGDTGTTGGFSQGQGAQREFDNDVPHWDREGHFRTQETTSERINRRKRMEIERERMEAEYSSAMSGLPAFLLISSVVGLAFMVPAYFIGGRKKRKDE